MLLFSFVQNQVNHGGIQLCYTTTFR